MRYTRLDFSLARKTCGLCMIVALSAVAVGCVPPDPAEQEDPANSCTEALVRGTRTQYATRLVALPPSNEDYLLEDFDGDQKVENAFRSIRTLDTLVGLGLQSAIADAIAVGQGVVLLELTAPDLKNADCASLAVFRAQPPHPALPLPKFMGKDFFQPEPTPQVTLYGAIKAGVFHSVRPSAQPPQDKHFELDLRIAKGVSLPLPLRGFSIEATLSEAVHGPTMSMGSLRGALTAQYVSERIAAALAERFTSLINHAKSLEEVEKIIEALESKDNPVSTNKCQVPADCCAASFQTCKILREEVVMSPLGGILSPDVRVFDDAGNWHPDPSRKGLNGFSVGLQFEAVGATF